MSAAKRVSRNADGDVVLTVTIVGAYDVYRFAGVMERGQMEFAALGRRTKNSLRRSIGGSRFGDLRRYLEGDGYYAGLSQRREG